MLVKQLSTMPSTLQIINRGYLLLSLLLCSFTIESKFQVLSMRWLSAPILKSDPPSFDSEHYHFLPGWIMGQLAFWDLRFHIDRDRNDTTTTTLWGCCETFMGRSMKNHV